MILNELFLSKKSKEQCGIVAQINPLVSMISHLNSSEDIRNSLRTIFQLLSWSSSLQCKYKKLKAMVFKVDFEKAFDSIRVKVSGRMERINSWDDVVSKVTSLLSKWKLKTLSIGGRLTLIKSVLTFIPLYQMSSFKFPIKVLNILESIRRKFFNGIEGNKRKLALISWDTVLASKKYGGLGVLSFFAMNRALLSKCVWRFFSQTSSMWTRTIKVIHGEKGNLGAHGNITRRSPWLDIV
nr:RNA-directed DNA polymerase, eukaryota [Tanacetum cinerariifolium]